MNQAIEIVSGYLRIRDILTLALVNRRFAEILSYTIDKARKRIGVIERVFLNPTRLYSVSIFTRSEHLFVRMGGIWWHLIRQYPANHYVDMGTKRYYPKITPSSERFHQTPRVFNNAVATSELIAKCGIVSIQQALNKRNLWIRSM